MPSLTRYRVAERGPAALDVRFGKVDRAANIILVGFQHEVRVERIGQSAAVIQVGTVQHQAVIVVTQLAVTAFSPRGVAVDIHIANLDTDRRIVTRGKFDCRRVSRRQDGQRQNQ